MCVLTFAIHRNHKVTVPCLLFLHFLNTTQFPFWITGLRGRLRGSSRGGRRPRGRRGAVSRGERGGLGDRRGLGGSERGREPRQHQQLGRQEGQASAHHHRALQRKPQPPSGRSSGHFRTKTLIDDLGNMSPHFSCSMIS